MAQAILVVNKSTYVEPVSGANVGTATLHGDPSGNLLVAIAAQAVAALIGNVRIQDGTTGALAVVAAPADAFAAPGATALEVMAFPMVFNGATNDRFRSQVADASAFTGVLNVQSLMRLAGATTTLAPEGFGSPLSDGRTVSVNGQVTAAVGYAFNSATLDRVRSGSAANLAAFSALGSLLSTPPGNWSQANNGGSGVQATTSKAAGGAGVRHVCTSFLASLASSAAVAQRSTFNLRDGATGAGTVLMSFDLSIVATADQDAIFGLAGLNLVGSAATAMTAEFAAAGAANTFQTVSMSGYDAS